MYEDTHYVSIYKWRDVKGETQSESMTCELVNYALFVYFHVFGCQSTKSTCTVTFLKKAADLQLQLGSKAK